MRVTRALIATALVCLVFVAASVAGSQKLKLRIVGVSHSYTAGKALLCVRVGSEPGASVFVEAYGAGVPNGHTWTEALVPRRGEITVGFTVTATGSHRLKITAQKKKVGRTVATRDYAVPALEAAPQGPFACA
jgi:hypothetical protein